MKKELVSAFIVSLILGTIIISMNVIQGKEVEITLEDLDLEDLKQQWEENDKASFINEGVNFTIINHFSKIICTIEEESGRDVKLAIKIPNEYISPSVLGNINTEDNVTITFVTSQNDTWLKMTLYAHQKVTFEISKGSLLLGRIKKGVHNFWNYVEYNGDAKGDETNIIVFIDKDEAGFEVDNKHIIVQYKTNFWGWYYPVDDASSGDTYYYVDDMGDKWRVVTHFKGELSGDVKVHAFPGASEGLNWDSLKGGLARTWISFQIGMKKAIIDLFGGSTPKYD